jgi:hypothetical protein
MKLIIRIQEMIARTKPRLKTAAFITAVGWLVAVGIGMSILWSYENTPGIAAKPPSSWPNDSHVQRENDRWTLVMLIHPHCPCSRATIGELAKVMANTQHRLTANVLFLKPIGFSEDWEKTDLWESARTIPGVKVLIDNGGTEARRFNAATSGQTILYDPHGNLRFSGGITASRGHSGDNMGHATIVSLVNAKVADRTETTVFGCPLFNDNSECGES